MYWLPKMTRRAPLPNMQRLRRGPQWADPLKAWGDVLVKQGHVRDALAKYDEALKYAPNWKELKEARAAAQKSKAD